MASVLHIYGSMYGISSSMRTLPSNATIAQGDLVTVSSGQLEVASAGSTLVGVLTNSGGVTSADVGTFNDTPYLEIVIDNDNIGTTFAATHIYAKFDITGTTGAQLVDTSTVSGTLNGTETGQLVCTRYNPQGVGSDSDLSIGGFLVSQAITDGIA